MRLLLSARPVTDRGRNFWVAGLAAGVLVAAGGAVAQDVAEEVPTIDAPAWFTEEQAEAGQSAYESNCAGCHGEEAVESLAGYPNAGSFYGFISSQMPADNPGGLAPETYADIIAYLLSANGFPAGEEELQPGREAMSEVIVRDLIPD